MVKIDSSRFESIELTARGIFRSTAVKESGPGAVLVAC